RDEACRPRRPGRHRAGGRGWGRGQAPGPGRGAGRAGGRRPAQGGAGAAALLRRLDTGTGRGAAWHLAGDRGPALGLPPRLALRRDDPGTRKTVSRQFFAPCREARRAEMALSLIEDHDAGVRAVSVSLDRLESLFTAALQKAPADRPAYLDQACAGDPGLRQRLEALLRAQGAAGSFLEPPAPSQVVTVDEQPVSESPGTVIGPYKFIERIGEGGMGTVWMAQQTEPVKRLVAVKLIKAGMDSRQVIARFEAERQALALMDHAHIARVLDAGTTG